MRKPLKIFQLVLVACLLGVVWACAAKLARIPNVGITKTLALSQLVSAFVLALCLVIFEKSVPRLSLRLLQTSMSLASCYFLFPGLLVLYSLKELPALVAALVFSTVPLWLWMFHLGRGKARPIYHAVTIAGVVIFFLGTVAYDKITYFQLLSLLFLFVASFFTATGFAISRKLFWMHSPLELHFWALVISALFSYLGGYLLNDPWPLETPELRYWVFVVLFGMISALASFCYRYVAFLLEEMEVLMLTLLVPVAAAIAGLIFFREETPTNFYSVTGICLFLGALGLACRTESSSVWLSHCLTNTRRKGDRVICFIDGFMQKEKGSLAKVQILDLSIGGLGFTTDSAFATGDRVTVSFGLGKSWTQIGIECKIVHIFKTEGKNSWLGGAQFFELEEHNMQILVEFLAKVGHVGERH